MNTTGEERPDTTSEFQPPPRNMVQEVRNIIDGYKMGPLRALAQDPVQNSLDAYDDGGNPVRVEYRLETRQLETGEDINLLTVTDHGTTGLRGVPLSLADLQNRAAATGFLQLSQDENWAAWEAMGYTKTGEDKLGSRGQGKAAFLYHSRRPLGIQGPGGVELEGMVILYDTLLDDGTYRLGVRLAQPADLVLFPPFEGQEARSIVEGRWTSPQGDLALPLQLEPLEEPGTRIIVPFLSEDATEAFRSGEMLRWLQLCWWRAIQIDRLEIRVTVDGTTETVDVPSFWKTAPWQDDPYPPNLLVKENIEIEADSDRRIKRIVLVHDPTLDADEIEDVDGAQFEGIQLLRGQQWIVTIPTQRYADLIPTDERPGLRGFVEFDRSLEAELREVESPQHDAFHRKRVFVKQIQLIIDEAVEEFAAEQGWLEDTSSEPRKDDTGDDVLRQVTELFMTGGAVDGDGDQDLWTCELALDYPHDVTTRVEWEDMLTGIWAECRHQPSTERRDVHLSLVLVDPMGDRRVLQSRDQRTKDGSAAADFTDIRVVKVAKKPDEIECPMVGRYRLRVECFCGDERVATASRNLYVRMDPPDPQPPQPITVDLQTRNADANRARINEGEHLDVNIIIKNRGPLPADLTVEASLEDLLFFDGEPVSLSARLAGDQPTTDTLVVTGIEVRTSGHTDPSAKIVVLDPGPHIVRVDIYGSGGDVVASASRTIWIEEDPDDGGPDLPFRLEPRSSLTLYQPVWELYAPHGDEPAWVLEYTTSHPAFRAALLAETVGADGQLAGQKLFFGEMVCGALLEWTLTRLREEGDEEGVQLLLDRAASDSGPLWELYRTCLEELVDQLDDPMEALRRERQAVSLMLYLYQANSEG